jgi:hypothetical protein
MRLNYKAVFGTMILLRIWGVGDEARQLGYTQRKHKVRACSCGPFLERCNDLEIRIECGSGGDEVSYLRAATTQSCENLFGALVREASGNLTFSNCQATLRYMLTTQALCHSLELSAVAPDRIRKAGAYMEEWTPPFGKTENEMVLSIGQGLLCAFQIFGFAMPEVWQTWPEELGDLGNPPFAGIEDFLDWLPQPRTGGYVELISSEQMSMRHGRESGPVAAAIEARQFDNA